MGWAARKLICIGLALHLIDLSAIGKTTVVLSTVDFVDLSILAFFMGHIGLITISLAIVGVVTMCVYFMGLAAVDFLDLSTVSLIVILLDQVTVGVTGVVLGVGVSPLYL